MQDIGEMDFEEQCSEYLFELGKVQILGDTIEELRHLQIGPSSRALVNYILSKIVIFHCNKLQMSLKNKVNIFKVEDFHLFIISESARFLIGKIQQEIDNW